MIPGILLFITVLWAELLNYGRNFYSQCRANASGDDDAVLK